jgi:hypothetical protein
MGGFVGNGARATAGAAVASDCAFDGNGRGSGTDGSAAVAAAGGADSGADEKGRIIVTLSGRADIATVPV